MKIAILLLLLVCTSFAQLNHMTWQENDSLNWITGFSTKGLIVKDTNGDTLTVIDSTYAKLDSINDQLSLSYGDDKGVIFSDQISVLGELIAGEDSRGITWAYHCQEANTTGRVVTGCTDVSAILNSDNGSHIGLFGGITKGSYLLAMDSESYEGVKIKYHSTGGLVEPDSVQNSYYENNTSGWIPVPSMTTNSSFPFGEHGDSIAVHNHASEQIFFGFNPLDRDQQDTWEATTWTVNGVEVTGKFGKWELVGSITADPQVEQIKLHSDRMEMEVGGGPFFYGQNRSPMELIVDVEETTSSPKDGTFVLTARSSIKGKKNKFESGQVDQIALRIERQWGLDTSVPLVIPIGYEIDGPGTGVVELIIESIQVNDGFIYDGNAPFQTDTITIDHSVSAEKVQGTINLLVPINKLQNNATVWVTITREAIGGSGVDTLNEDFIVTSVRAYGYRWKL